MCGTIHAPIAQAMRPDFTNDQNAELYDQFREIKHSINNSLAVIMAFSELAQRNPVHYEKLAENVLARCPEIVTLLEDFENELTRNNSEAGE